MALSIPLVWADEHRLHEPSAEIWVGVRTPATELPARADAIRADARRRPGAEVVAAARTTTRRSRRCTIRACSHFSPRRWADWEAAGLPDDPGQDQVVPYIFPHPGLMGGLEPCVPAATWARPGAFCFDTMTLIGPGTWEAARGRSGRGADGGRSRLGRSADRVRLLPAARPSRHAQRLRRLVLPQQRRDRGAAPARARCRARRDRRHRRASRERRPVDLLGADDVFTGSVHIDPATGWFPHFLGGAVRARWRCRARLEPQRPAATGRAGRRLAAGRCRARAGGAVSGAEALVLALGVDAAGGDPESPLARYGSGFREAGR